MATSVPADAIVVSEGSLRGPDSLIVASNVAHLNALFAELVSPDEVSADALRSYYVDYWLAQMRDHGFARFVYASRWEPRLVRLVREGLRAIAGRRHLEVFEAGARLVAQLAPGALEAFVAGDHHSAHPTRRALGSLDAVFRHTERSAPLLRANAAWLRAHPKLVALAPAAMEAEVRRRAEELPDRDARLAAARAREPRYAKVARALCERAGLELDRVTAADVVPGPDGAPAKAIHLVASGAHSHMIESGGRAILFRGSTTERVCEIDVAELDAR
jgi:hypothetical protein